MTLTNIDPATQAIVDKLAVVVAKEVNKWRLAVREYLETKKEVQRLNGLPYAAQDGKAAMEALRANDAALLRLIELSQEGK